jgi:molybdopterin/thiamine biosynthesis adenylyltransferase
VEDRYDRQSFLGAGSQSVIERAVVGVTGLGGGGSHVVQQLAHIGFQHYVLYDPDAVEETNLNRLVGATAADARAGTPKLAVARCVVAGLQPDASVERIPQRWQENPGPLRSCDVVVGCVDGFRERGELEAAARRYLIPLVDIGMDVHCVGDEPPRMSGQVILSTPGGYCMRCMRFLTDRALAREAERYGDAGPRPQVVWPNGVLASTAVGLVVDLLTDWTRSSNEVVYLEYDGNRGTVQPSSRLLYLPEGPCAHYPPDQVGDLLL